MSLRVLEGPAGLKDIKICLANEKVGDIEHYFSIKPIATETNKLYLDPEYFFLERNLKSINEAVEPGKT
jgi:hypothetical protein